MGEVSDDLAGFWWLSPRARMARKLRAGRNPDAVFETGGEISAWFRAMNQKYGDGIAEGIRSIAALFIMRGVSQLVSVGETYLPWHFQFIDPLMGVATIVVPLWFLWQAINHFGAAMAYADEWKALEALGIQWHLENGHQFRLLYKRLDGTYKIDPLTRQKRVEQEFSPAYLNSMTGRAGRGAVLFAGVAIVIYFGSTAIVDYLGWAFFVRVNVPGLLTAWYVWASLPAELTRTVEDFMHRAAVKAGCQYIPNAKVLDPFIKPLTRETVEENKAHGSSAFAEPDEASQQLGS